MTVKIGINGFGRIGRLAFRRIFELQARGGQAGDIEVAAINDLTTPATLAYLLKYDSTHGTFRHDDGTPVDVKATEDSIIVDGKEYKVYAEKDANNIPWVKNDGVEYVLECTGFYTSAEKSQAHINAGAKKVLISAPAKDDTTPTVVFGVNHDILKASDVIVSAGSCTTNSMAAMVKLLDEKFGIKAGFMTTIHAYTGTQMLLDGPRGTKTGRNLRAAAINTIAHSTGAAKAIGKVVPSVNGKLQGHAQRVQVPDDSVTELTTVLNYAVVPVVIDKELPSPAFYDETNLELAINPDYPDNEAFAAIAAEVAHSRFHAKGANRSYDRGECDLDAQSISYILCRRYGIERPMPDMTNLAGLYEGWEPQERRQALDTIQDTSKQFGRSIEKNLEMGKQRSRAPVHRPTR